MSNADPLSAKISPFPNLVRTFSLNMLIKYYFYPHFWSQGGVNDHKDAMYRCVSNIDGCGIFPKSLYVNSSSFANLFRIFPWKYPQFGLGTPRFGPKRSLNILKDAIYRCVFNENGCGRLPNLWSDKISPYPNLFRTFSQNISIK